MNKVIVGLMLGVLSASSLAVVSTAEKQVDRIEVIQVVDRARYKFFNAEGWNAPGCEAYQYAYLHDNDIGGKDVFSLVIAAKATQSKVKFYGECVSGLPGFKINQIHYLGQ